MHQIDTNWQRKNSTQYGKKQKSCVRSSHGWLRGTLTRALKYLIAVVGLLFPKLRLMMTDM